MLSRKCRCIIQSNPLFSDTSVHDKQFRLCWNATHIEADNATSILSLMRLPVAHLARTETFGVKLNVDWLHLIINDYGSSSLDTSSEITSHGSYN